MKKTQILVQNGCRFSSTTRTPNHRLCCQAYDSDSVELTSLSPGAVDAYWVSESGSNADMSISPDTALVSDFASSPGERDKARRPRASCVPVTYRH